MRAMPQDVEGYTRFGWYLEELMGRHRIRGQRELARILREGGYPIQQPAISKMMRGESEAKSAFNSALIEILGLDEAEAKEYATMAAVVQADKRRLSWENMKRLREVEALAEEDAGEEAWARENNGEDRRA